MSGPSEQRKSVNPADYSEPLTLRSIQNWIGEQTCFCGCLFILVFGGWILGFGLLLSGAR